MGQNVVLIVNTPTPRTNLDVAAELLQSCLNLFF